MGVLVSAAVDCAGELDRPIERMDFWREDDPVRLLAKVWMLAEQLFGQADQLSLVWWLEASATPAGALPGALDPARFELVTRARLSGEEQPLLGAEATLAWPLLLGDEGLAVVLALPAAHAEATARARWREWLPDLRPCLARVLQQQRLQRRLQQLQQTERIQRALYAIADLAGSDLDMDEVLSELHAIVGGLMYAENFYLALYDPSRDAIRFIYWADVIDPAAVDPAEWVELQRFERSLTWYLIRDGHPLKGSTEELSTQVSGPVRLIGTDSGDWLGVPMLSGGAVRGVLVVQSYDGKRHYRDDERAVLEFVASHILTALERKQGKEALEQEVARRTRELDQRNRELASEVIERERGERLQRALFEIAGLATDSGSQASVYAAIHRVIDNLIQARNFYIALLSADRSTLHFPYYADSVEPPPASRPVGRGITEYLIEQGRPLLADAEELLRLHAAGAFVGLGTPSVSWLGVPLLIDGRVIGAIVAQSYVADVRYGPRDLDLLTFVAQQIAHTLQRRQADDELRAAHAALEQRVEERTRELREQIAVREKIELQLKHEVMHDNLTGLPNRGYLRDRLERVLAQHRRGRGRDFAVLYCDVDRFKLINDSLGHLAGDQVLKEVASRLLSCVREPDVVARLGGDEFAILLEDLPGMEIAVRVAQRVLLRMAEPLRVLDKELTVSSSVGVAMGSARHHSADDLLRDADAAMYRAKRGGRHRFEIFDAELNQHALDVLQMEGEIRHGLGREEFQPYLQPIVRLHDGVVVGYEALVRWLHPQRGVLPPGGFLPVAEESGQVEAIDWQLFDLACASAARLPAGQYLSINVAPRYFAQEGFGERLLQLLQRHGLAAERLRVELTEGAMLEQPDKVIAVLRQLGEAGIVAAVDDFGTGYSSLSYIHKMPLRTLKIDRSFVADLGGDNAHGSLAVVRAVLALAQSLELDAVAEGIETEQQRQILLALGCRLGQGFLFARPQPVADLLAAAV